MNIFVLHSDPMLAAAYHVDRHVIKMPIESAQMLSTVLRERCGIDYGYKSAYVNHPCTQWAGESFENWSWLWKLGVELCYEYTHRYGREHKTYGVLLGMMEHTEPVMKILGKNVGMTSHYKAVSDRFKKYDPITAYRLYYYFVKTRLHDWTKREVPEFIFTHVEGAAYEFGPIPYPQGYDAGIDPSYR